MVCASAFTSCEHLSRLLLVSVIVLFALEVMLLM